MSAEMQLLLALVDEAYDSRSWHGTNLRGSLRGLSAGEAAWRPGPRRHNIWEIALHAAYWKYAVRRRLTGMKRGSFALKGSNWFRRPAEPSRSGEIELRADLALLASEHRQLRDVVASFDRARLSRRVTSGQSTAAELIRGIAAHDLYHAGQIQLLKRLLAS